MRWIRHVVVLDTADFDAQSAFWAGMLSGQVFADDTFHSVIDGDGVWRIRVQLAPNHVPPEWPYGNPQQVHIDLNVDDPRAGHDRAIELAARMLYPDDLDSAEGHRVYADPAGHPFCIGWGHPDEAALRAFVERQR